MSPVTAHYLIIRTQRISHPDSHRLGQMGIDGSGFEFALAGDCRHIKTETKQLQALLCGVDTRSVTTLCIRMQYIEKRLTVGLQRRKRVL